MVTSEALGRMRGSRIGNTTGLTTSPARPIRKTALKPIVVAAKRSAKTGRNEWFQQRSPAKSPGDIRQTNNRHGSEQQERIGIADRFDQPRASPDCVQTTTKGRSPAGRGRRTRYICDNFGSGRHSRETTISWAGSTGYYSLPVRARRNCFCRETRVY